MTGTFETIMATLHQRSAEPFYLELLQQVQLAVQREIARAGRSKSPLYARPEQETAEP